MRSPQNFFTNDIQGRLFFRYHISTWRGRSESAFRQPISGCSPWRRCQLRACWKTSYIRLLKLVYLGHYDKNDCIKKSDYPLGRLLVTVVNGLVWFMSGPGRLNFLKPWPNRTEPKLRLRLSLALENHSSLVQSLS